MFLLPWSLIKEDDLIFSGRVSECGPSSSPPACFHPRPACPPLHCTMHYALFMISTLWVGYKRIKQQPGEFDAIQRPRIALLVCLVPISFALSENYEDIYLDT